MDERWTLTTMLNGNYNRTVWNTQEGAIADRERLLMPRRVKDRTSPTGFKMEWPLGWTAIRRLAGKGD